MDQERDQKTFKIIWFLHRALHRKTFSKLEFQGWNYKNNLYSEMDQERDQKTFKIIFFRSSSGMFLHSKILFVFKRSRTRSKDFKNNYRLSCTSKNLFKAGGARMELNN